MMQYLDHLCKIRTTEFIQDAYNDKKLKKLHHLYYIFSKYSDEMMTNIIIPFEYSYLYHRIVQLKNKPFLLKVKLSRSN